MTKKTYKLILAIWITKVFLVVARAGKINKDSDPRPYFSIVSVEF